MEETTANLEGGNNGAGASGEAPIGLGVEAVKRGRGRPPGSTNKNRPADFGAKKENVSRRAPDLDAMESAKFIGTSLVTIVDLLDSFVQSSCLGRIEKKRPDKLEEFRIMAAKFSLGEGDKKLIAESGEKVALRYEVLSRFGPEVVLGVTLGQYAVRQLALLKFVNAVTTQKPITEPAPANT